MVAAAMMFRKDEDGPMQGLRQRGLGMDGGAFWYLDELKTVFVISCLEIGG